MSDSIVYDFETPVEAAWKTAMGTITGLTLYTPADTADDAANVDEGQLMQLLRPHAQGMLMMGAGLRQRPYIAALATDERETCWSAQFRVDLVTDAKLVDHRAFLATLRNKMAQLMSAANGVTLTNHRISWLEENGSTYAFTPERGVLQTTLIYNLKISVQADAWAKL